MYIYLLKMNNLYIYIMDIVYILYITTNIKIKI